MYMCDMLLCVKGLLTNYRSRLVSTRKILPRKSHSNMYEVSSEEGAHKKAIARKNDREENISIA